jgi:hypothetical protein
MLATSWILGLADAQAAPISRKFCFDYVTTLFDAAGNGDDFMTDLDGPYDAAYAYTSIANLTTGVPVRNGYLDINGCTPFLTIESTHTHRATLISWVLLPTGQEIEVQRSRIDDTAFSQSATMSTYPKSVITVQADANGFDKEWVNILAVATHTIRRKPDAWPADAMPYLYFFEGETGDPTKFYYTTTNGADLPNPGVVIPNQGFPKNQKFVIAHELGHNLEYKIHCSEGGGDCENPDYRLRVDYDAPGGACQVGGTDDDHFVNSKEFQSAAAVEGWANYVVAFAFNERTGATCRLKPNAVVPWNYIEPGQVTDGTTDAPFSCEGSDGPTPDLGGAEHTTPPEPVQGRDAYGQFCEGTGGVDDNRGTEVDWLRFWWDYTQTPGLGFLSATAIVDAMDSHTWNRNDTGLIQDLPAKRLESAMQVHGPLYDLLRNNGVDR